MVTSQSVTRRCARPGFGGRAPRGGAEGAGVGGGLRLAWPLGRGRAS